MNFLQPVFSKEEKQDLLNNLDEINKKLHLLSGGDRVSLYSTFGSLKEAIESYSTPQEKDIAEIYQKIKECLALIQDSVAYTEAAKNEIENDLNTSKIQSEHFKQIYEESTLNAKTVTDLKDQCNGHLQDVVSKKNALSNVSDEIARLTVSADEALNKLANFDEAVASVEESKNKVLITQKNTRELLIEVKSLYAEIFGEEVKDEDSEDVLVVKGLASKLESAYEKVENDLTELKTNFEDFENTKKNEYNQVKTEWENEFVNLKSQIESLLPGALSAGLSQAYEDKKNYEITEIKKANDVFYKAISALIGISLMPAILYIVLLAIEKRTLEEIASLSPSVFLAMLPIYIPCLWVAYSSDKKAKLSKRLSEEYAHKASISKTFEGISKQVGKVSDSKMAEALETKLLFNLINVSSENPGKLISDYDKSDHPLYDALDKGIAFSETLEKISFIPGISKIITSVQKRTQKRMESLADGLDDVETLSSKTQS